jgi:hypothetical protein
MDYKSLYANLFGNLFTNIPELMAIVGECIDNNHDAAEYIRRTIDEDIINETVRLALEPEPGEVNEDGENEDDMYLARIGYSDKDEQKTTTILSVDPPAQIRVRGWDSNVPINPPPLNDSDHRRFFYQSPVMGDDEIVNRARVDISEMIFRETRGMGNSFDIVTHIVESILLSFKNRGIIHRSAIFWDDMGNRLVIRIARGSYACEFSFDKYLLTSY